MVDKEKNEILLILKKLIENRSDSNSLYEKTFEAVILEEIETIEYFKTHRDNYGRFQIPGDTYERSVIWALADCHAEKTVILFGHHDAVGTSVYGEINALDCENVKAQLKTQLNLSTAAGSDFEKDLCSEEWIFGRGSCDMKAGIAINLDQLRQVTQNHSGVNLLFLSVPDEENQSLGMRCASSLLLKLKEKFKLQYELAILTEPHSRITPETFTVSSGSVGKMMPIIVSKGIPSHSGIAYSGLNSVSIAMEVIKAIELNTEMGDSICKKMTPPPAFLSFKTIKDAYDVTTPEYAVGYFNWLYLKENLAGKFEQLKELCKWSVEDAINQFNYSYNEFLRKQAMPSYQDCMNFDFEILLYDELVEKVMTQCPMNFDHFYQAEKDAHPELNSQDFTANIIMKLMDRLKVNYPMVVIGLLPPFYPVVDSSCYYEDVLKAPLTERLNQMNLELSCDRYFMGISDMSYIKKMKHDPSQIMKHMPLYDRAYQINFDEIEALDIDVIHIGPWGKDLHQKTERVYVKDVVEVVPNLIACILEQISK